MGQGFSSVSGPPRRDEGPQLGQAANRAAQLLSLKGGPLLAPGFSVDQLLGYFSPFCGIVLMLRVVIAIARERLG